MFQAAQLTHTPLDHIYFRENTTLQDLKKYKVLFYPHATILTMDRVKLLEEYVDQGGVLVMGCRTGYKDINGKCVMDYLPGLASKLTGTDVLEYSFVAPDDGTIFALWEGMKLEAAVFNDLLAPVGKNSEIVGRYINSYYKETPALIKNKFGNGYAYYFGGAFTTDTAKVFLQKLGVKSPYENLVELPESCEIAVRQKDKDKFIFILNYSSEKAQIKILSDMINLYTGESVNGVQMLDGYETIVLKIR